MDYNLKSRPIKFGLWAKFLATFVIIGMIQLLGLFAHLMIKLHYWFVAALGL